MKTVGIVVEYNPLHNGHVYHFQQSKQLAGADAVVAVMSGPFLQRGEPALVNKWARAEMALNMGVDLVLELPCAYSSQAAEWFAYGAVFTLDRIGVVDSLCFGSESGDIEWLSFLADQVHEESGVFRTLLQKRISEGRNYPSAYSAALKDWLGDQTEAQGSRLAEPNNTLGLHYLIALKRLNSRIIPYTVSRHKSGYGDKQPSDQHIASATALRRMLDEAGGPSSLRPYVPDYTYRIISRELEAGRGPISWDRYMQPLLHLLVSRTETELEQLYEVSEGLEYRIKQALTRFTPNPGCSSGRNPHEGLSSPFEQWLDLLKTKRYTRTKLQRMLVRILLNHSKQALARSVLQEGPDYARVLGFSAKGRELLKRMKLVSTLRPLVKIPRERSAFLDMDLKASGVYALGYGCASAEAMFQDHYQSPLQLNV